MEYRIHLYQEEMKMKILGFSSISFLRIFS
ncbi:unnamed protein product [Debaryomyces tyrocola]|nr:unnamed protein product [Debaryomyces tyrocola]